MDDMAAALARAHAHATEFLDGLDRRSVAATASLSQLRQRLGVALTADGVPAAHVIDEMVAAADGGHLGSGGGRFFAWVVGGALPSALAADWLVSTWDNNAVLYACGPAAAVVEEISGTWVKEILGLPPEASFAFTTGCQMAHFTCLAAARHAMLRDRGWDVERDGLAGAPAIRVLATEHHHASITRALRFLGLGTKSLVPLKTDAEFRVSAKVLEETLAASDAPTILVLDAGDLNVGAFDPFSHLIPIARAAKAWVHVDGAFGLWARASTRLRDRLAGVELADSWATDAHKWLNTPKDIGVAIVKDRDAHRAAMGVAASYMAQAEDARDQIDWTPEWTRRARGFPVYAALRELGRDGVAAMIDRCCAHAAVLADGIGALEGAVLVARPTLNQGLIRFRDPRPSANEADHDRYTEEMVAAINEDGTAFFSMGAWQGRRVMRISVVNWRTSDDDVRQTVEAIAKVLARRRAA
jgi:glutamate/tyrosine decarboxylase-like PLP-dependent enzyme